MKKALCLVLVGFMLLSGCQSDNNSTDEITISETTTQTEEQQQAMATTAPTQTTTSQTTTPKSEQTTTQEITVTTTEPPTTPPQTTPPQTSATTTKATTKLTETTTTKKEEKSEMPEIVFIVFENTCLGWDNVIYGHYIDDKGDIRYFEFYDDTKAAFEHKGEEFYYNYCDNFFYDKDYGVNLLKEKYDEIIKNSIETEYKIDMDKLTDMYNRLMNVDINSEFEIQDDTMLCIDVRMRFFYGVRANGNNEIIFIQGESLMSFISTDDNADVLYDELGKFFIPFSNEYYPALYK